MIRRLGKCLNPAIHFIVDLCYDEAIVWCIICTCIATARMLISVIET